jgi:hypothetical protein
MTGKFTSGIKKAEKGFAQLRKDINTTNGQLRAIAGAAGFGYAAAELFEFGAAVEETGSKFRTVFGEDSQQVQTELAGVARVAGLTTQQMQELTATTGGILQGFGFAQSESADLAVELQKLAADLGSFNNIPVAETSRAIQAAMTGEREQLKRLGVVIREVDVQQRALVNTGKESASQLTNQEKATATLQIITERAGFAVGDLARTQDTAAAKARIMTATLGEIRDKIATALLPVMSFLVDKFNNLVQWVEAAGAQAAVFMAQIDLLLAKFKRWDKEGIQAATANLERMKEAAGQVMTEIDMMSRSIAGSGGGGGAPSATEALTIATASARDLGSEFITQSTLVIPQITSVTQAYAEALLRARQEQEGLNSATSKFRGISGALGFLGRFVPAIAGLASGVGTIGTGVGIVSGLRNTFGGGNQASAQLDAGGGVTVNINGPGLQALVDTIEVEQGRSRNLRRVERV